MAWRRRTLIAAIAIGAAACLNRQPSPPLGPPSIALSPAPPGSCVIDAAGMCQVLAGAGEAQRRAPAAVSVSGTPPPPDSFEFQVPAGQAIKLMCYFDSPHVSIIKAESTLDSPLTDNSVAYLKSQGFCLNK